MSKPILFIQHRPGSPGLRLGFGPGLRHVGAIVQLQGLFDAHSFWARKRSRTQLRRMLRGSQVVVTAWEGNRLVGFGRATSDGEFRAVLWDVVVDGHRQGLGLGRTLVETLLASAKVAAAERIYLMTSNSQGFYERLGFQAVKNQQLMLVQKSG